MRCVSQVNISEECRERILATDVTAYDIFDEARAEVLAVLEVSGLCRNCTTCCGIPGRRMVCGEPLLYTIGGFAALVQNFFVFLSPQPFEVWTQAPRSNAECRARSRRLRKRGTTLRPVQAKNTCLPRSKMETEWSWGPFAPSMLGLDREGPRFPPTPPPALSAYNRHRGGISSGDVLP